MLNFKKIMAAILAMSSGAVFANSITPGQSKIWEVGVSALYLHPSFAGNGLGYSTYSNYAGANNSGVIFTSNSSNQINNVTPEWGFGTMLEVAYYFGTRNDLNLNWSHLRGNVDSHLPTGSLFSGSVDGFYAGNLQLETKWDAINLEVGQNIYFSARKLMRLHAGLEFARIKNTFTNEPKLFSTGSAYFVSTDLLSYSGLGPRLGADFDYALAKGISLYVNTAGSALVGTAKQTVSGYRDYTNTVYGLIPFGIPNYNLSNHNVVVPELEAKLGLTYERKLAQGRLGVDLGYLWMNYLNAIASYTGVGIVGSSIGVPATTNFNLNGLYFGVSWMGVA